MVVFEDVTKVSGVSGSELPRNPPLFLLQELLEMLGSSDPDSGLMSVVEGFRQSGLGDVMSSWIGTSRNLTISPQELRQGLGAERVRQLARSAGLTDDAAASVLARLLPPIVDTLTAGGDVPEPRRLQRRVVNLRRSFGV